MSEILYKTEKIDIEYLYEKMNSMLIPPYLILSAYILTLWISSIATICSIDSCSYGTKCYFQTINDTCILSVDNQTIVIDKNTASGDALYACTQNTSLDCYYAKSRDSTGQFLSDNYKTECKDHYYNWLSGIIISDSAILLLILSFYIAISIMDLSHTNKNTSPT